jgi:hypothetical protein
VLTTNELSSESVYQQSLDTPFTQDGQWSVPLPADECSLLPEPALYAIKQFGIVQRVSVPAELCREKGCTLELGQEDRYELLNCIAHYFQSQLCMQLSNSYLSSCPSSRVHPFSLQSSAGMTTTPGANKDRFLSVGWDMINLIESKINKYILELTDRSMLRIYSRMVIKAHLSCAHSGAGAPTHLEELVETLHHDHYPRCKQRQISQRRLGHDQSN